MYNKVSTGMNFVEREKEVEKFWKDKDIFRKSIKLREGAPTYMFYDGPPTANGKPHIGHVLTRVIKDMIPRYRTMKGYRVPRKAGWDTHGLPVELEVEKLLGSVKEDKFSILLAHNPEYFKSYAKWGADLTVSGHIHGGIMRLPLIGGVISPSLRLFPKYDSGEFEENGKKMILSRGMGLHHIKLRFFNRPEISVIKITCQDKSK